MAQRLCNRLSVERHAIDQLYPGGREAMEAFLCSREEPFRNLDTVLPEETPDLDEIRKRIIPDIYGPSRDAITSDAKQKMELLYSIFAGRSELLALHGMVVAVLRRRDPPERARTIFLEMWRMHGNFLAAALPTRWRIAAATTFAEYGESETERQIGLKLTLIFDLIKLHDSERSLSGAPNDRSFKAKPTILQHSIAFGLKPYDFDYGDLDLIMLAKLSRDIRQDLIIQPLANRMLQLLMGDKRSIFARVQIHKGPEVRANRSRS